MSMASSSYVSSCSSASLSEVLMNAKKGGVSYFFSKKTNWIDTYSRRSLPLFLPCPCDCKVDLLFFFCVSFLWVWVWPSDWEIYWLKCSSTSSSSESSFSLSSLSSPRRILLFSACPAFIAPSPTGNNDSLSDQPLDCRQFGHRIVPLLSLSFLCCCCLVSDSLYSS